MRGACRCRYIELQTVILSRPVGGSASTESQNYSAPNSRKLFGVLSEFARKRSTRPQGAGFIAVDDFVSCCSEIGVDPTAAAEVRRSHDLSTATVPREQAWNTACTSHSVDMLCAGGTRDSNARRISSTTGCSYKRSDGPSVAAVRF